MNMFLPLFPFQLMCLLWRNTLRVQSTCVENMNDAFASWGKMMSADWVTTRQFLGSATIGTQKPYRNVTLTHDGNLTSVVYGARFMIPSYYPTHTASIHQLHPHYSLK